MKPVARVGDQVACGHPHHPPNPIVSGGQSTVDGRPVARLGDSAACGAKIIQGSSESTDQGKPVAYLGCATMCGPFPGKIIGGSHSSTVKP